MASVIDVLIIAVIAIALPSVFIVMIAINVSDNRDYARRRVAEHLRQLEDWFDREYGDW